MDESTQGNVSIIAFEAALLALNESMHGSMKAHTIVIWLIYLTHLNKFLQELTTNGDAGSPTKSHSKIPGPKRSTSSSPTKSPSKSAKGLPKTPDAATSASAEKKSKEYSRLKKEIIVLLQFV